MGLFDAQARSVLAFLADKRARKELIELAPRAGWPEAPSLVLEEDTALELGHPLQGSLAFIVWTSDPGIVGDGIDLVGPDVDAISQARAPLAQIVMVSGEFGEEYECYRELKDAVYGVKLTGVMARAMPSRQSFWYRVSREARARGFSLAHLGAALLQKLKAVKFVRSARIVFVTSGKPDLEALTAPARETGRIAGALNKMYEEMNYDCAECEYSDVCAEAIELKKIRERMVKRSAT
ncbi:MAG TPA: hypothetical protein VM658_10115 [bacterium]|nr:hypothetical protein [bacterium]